MSYRDRDRGNDRGDRGGNDRDGRGSRRPPETDEMISLKVDNLTYKTTPESLKRVFDRYGDVGDVYIPRDPYTQDSRGFAFVRYFDQRDADDAIDAMDGQMLDGRPLRVQLARHARPQQAGFRRGGSGGGGGGGGPPRRRRSNSRSRSRSRSRGRRNKSRSNSKSRSRSAGSDKKARGSRTRRDKERSKSRSASPANGKSGGKGNDKSGAKKSRSRSRSAGDD